MAPESLNATKDLRQPSEKQVNPLTSLASFPCNIKVYGQNHDEKILLFVREHKIILFFNLFAYSIVAFMPFYLSSGINLLDNLVFNNTLNLQGFFASKWWTVTSIIWFSFMLIGYFNIFFKWFYNINILTSNRFVDIDFIGIFTTRIEETSLMSIEDVKDLQSGVIQSLFNMGDLEIFTASGKTSFNLSNVPKSHKIRDFIMDIVVVERKKANANN